MALSITLGERFAPQAFEATFARSSFFLQAGRFSLAADLFGAPEGSPRFESYAFEDGSGWGLVLGSLLVEVGHG